MLNVRGLLAIAADGDKARADRPKPLHWLAKWRNRFHSATLTRQVEIKGNEGGAVAAVSAKISGWRVGDAGADGRKIVGQRKHGAIFVPVWG
jgi:hypothetical protein